ncbi:hypothetical protein MRB53_018535 [Persea americana]|uniref:Uncharacterized protein n=1 Tax=Persea americana TaxID=3435 RepID=A0ACC2M940_PERAE|nr:hypothetical protein MRB53_018535 [Persea americana]
MSHPHHLFIYIYTSICTFILTVSNGYPVNRTIPACPSTTCGNLTISYPFWLSNGAPTPQYCGYPGFNISCNIQHQPIFHLPDHHKYYVRNINYTEATINLFDMDLMGETCPKPNHNTTTPPNTLPLLDYSPLNLKLTFFFNCSSANSSYGGEIRCLRNTTGNSKTSFVFREGDVPEFEWSKYCEESVVVPVLAIEAESGNYIDFRGLLLKGFYLDWDSGDGDCMLCEVTNGCCGYGSNSGKFSCFCQDGVHARDCYDGTLSSSFKLSFYYNFNWFLNLPMIVICN